MIVISQVHPNLAKIQARVPGSLFKKTRRHGSVWGHLWVMKKAVKRWKSMEIAGKLKQKAMENHNFSWENPLFLWPFSIATLNYQRVSPMGSSDFSKPDFQWEIAAKLHRFFGISASV